MEKPGLKLLMLILLFSCTRTNRKIYNSEDCKKYIAAKQGFWIRISSDLQKGSDVRFRQGHRYLIPQKIKKESINQTYYYLTDDIKLTDTLTMTYGEKKYNIYDFKNVIETATDGSNHEKVDICRIATATINGAIIKDSNDNVLPIKVQ